MMATVAASKNVAASRLLIFVPTETRFLVGDPYV